MFVSFAPRSGARKLARGTRFLRTPGNRRYTALRLRSSVPPLHVQTNHCGSRQCRITQNLFVPAIENVFDPQHQIDERAERIASAQIDFLVSRISHDSKTDSIGVLALTHKRRIEIHEPTAK